VAQESIRPLEKRTMMLAHNRQSWQYCPRYIHQLRTFQHTTRHRLHPEKYKQLPPSSSRHISTAPCQHHRFHYHHPNLPACRSTGIGVTEPLPPPSMARRAVLAPYINCKHCPNVPRHAAGDAEDCILCRCARRHATAHVLHGLHG
jgi:hypothetical protein